MLTPDYLQKVTERTEESAAELNTKIAKKTAKKTENLLKEVFAAGALSSVVYSVVKNKYTAELKNEVTAELSKGLPIVGKEIISSFKDVTQKAKQETASVTKEIAKQVEVELPKDIEKLTTKEQKMIDAALTRTQNEVYNVTRTTAIGNQQTFIEACDKAFYDMRNGKDLNSAISEAIDYVGKKGTRVAVYASRTDKIETAIARAVRTGLNQAHSDVMLTRCAETGAGYVIVSQHLGARVTPFNDYTNHSWWQGKVYQLDFSKPELAKYNVSELEEQDIRKSHPYIAEINDKINSK